MKESIIESYSDEKLLFLTDEFDSAIIGVDSNSKRIVYSKSKMIDAIVDSDKEEDDEETGESAYNRAIEHIEYNTIRACQYMGGDAPIIVDDLFGE